MVVSTTVEHEHGQVDASMSTVDTEYDRDVISKVQKKARVMDAREMMKFFQMNQKAKTSLETNKKSVSRSSTRTSARGSPNTNQVPNIKKNKIYQQKTISTKMGVKGVQLGAQKMTTIQHNHLLMRGQLRGQPKDIKGGGGGQSHIELLYKLQITSLEIRNLNLKRKI